MSSKVSNNSDQSGQAARVYAIGTLDTKQEEMLYVAQAIQASGVAVTIVDVGTRKVAQPVTELSGVPVISSGAVADFHPQGREFFNVDLNSKLDRGTAVAAMSQALTELLSDDYAQGLFSAVIGIGGSGGTSLITHAMQALPIGAPKLMVSTMASGNVAPYIDCSDITLMYSVVDIAGLNAISEKVLGNAAAAIAGMAAQSTQTASNTTSERQPTLAITMFGVTTPCVDAVRKTLCAAGYHCLIFHATGSGGRAMEKLVASGLIDGVLDVTTTEIADEIVGGVLSAGPNRLDAIIASGVPYVLSLGALDMVNFAGMDTVPEQFKQRLLHRHNPDVTLMRTTAEECRAIARWVARKINQFSSPLIILMPEQGLSMMDAPGQPFYDANANAALIDELKSAIDQTPIRQLRSLPCNINDLEFSDALTAAYLELAQQQTSSTLNMKTEDVFND